MHSAISFHLVTRRLANKGLNQIAIYIQDKFLILFLVRFIRRNRFNTQKLLVIDPWNPYKGPFLSEFLFASCCVCYIPEQPFVITPNPTASASHQSPQYIAAPASSSSSSLSSSLQQSNSKRDGEMDLKIEFWTIESKSHQTTRNWISFLSKMKFDKHNISPRITGLCGKHFWFHYQI